MRLAEGNLAVTRRFVARFAAEVSPSLGRRISALVALPIAGAFLFSGSAFAQDGEMLSGEITRRIEATFELVLGNSAELAIPLTRRALARRMSESREDAVAPLAYGATDASDIERTAAAPSVPDESSAEEPEDENIARLPRPRPVEATDASEDDSVQSEIAQSEAVEPVLSGGEAGTGSIGSPLDLVAGAGEAESAPVAAASVEEGEDAPVVTASVNEASEPVAAVSVGEAESAPVAVASVGQANSEPAVANTAKAKSDIVVVAAGEPISDLSLVLAAADPAETGNPAAEDVVAAPATGGPLELVASQSCLSPEDLADKDGDFRRNAEILSDSALCIGEEKFKERRRNWTIETIKTSRPGPLFAVMHDDEDLSFDNAVAALRLYGGTLVSIETGGKRNQDGIDPNRNFSADGIGCRKLGNDAAPLFTEFFHQLLDPGQPVIAFHNNTGERIPTGGLGHVSMDDVPKDMEPRDSVDPDGPLAGERTLVLLTSPVPVTATSRTRADALAARGINAVVEPVREGKGDCSLSNYTLLIGHSDYFNVTVDKDEGEKQMRIIDEILGKPDQTVATQ